MNEKKEPNQDESLIAAIEDNLDGMSRSDLILNVKFFRSARDKAVQREDGLQRELTAAKSELDRAVDELDKAADHQHASDLAYGEMLEKLQTNLTEAVEALKEMRIVYGIGYSSAARTALQHADQIIERNRRISEMRGMDAVAWKTVELIGALTEERSDAK